MKVTVMYYIVWTLASLCPFASLLAFYFAREYLRLRRICERDRQQRKIMRQNNATDRELAGIKQESVEKQLARMTAERDRWRRIAHDADQARLRAVEGKA